jgi:hypothetical protein
MIDDVELRYRQQLTPGDLRLIDGVLAETVRRDRATGPGTPAGTTGPGSTGLSAVLGDPALEAEVLGAEAEGGPLLGASPFLAFAVAVHRTAARLEQASFVEERWAPRRRVPVFDVEALRRFLAGPERRLFLVELLASYTHVVSGATWQRTRRGWRRRRFSELDMARLAELLDAVEPAERPGVYRRLGDLALFLAGVFPDHPSLVEMGPLAASRLARLARPGQTEAAPCAGAAGQELLEELGRRFYASAVRSARAHGAPATWGLAVVEQVGERFQEARRVLNVVTDWYLFPLRERWFGWGR